MITMAEPPFKVATAEDREVVAGLARLLYMVYCERKNFAPNPAPYVPAWALDYARVAVVWLGYDELAADAIVAVGEG